MSVTHFGIVYASGSAQIRRYIYPTHSDAEIASHPLMPGEALVTRSIGPYPNSPAWQAAVTSAVTTAAGKAPGNPACAVVDGSNNVVGVINADPAIDSVPGFTLIAAYSPQISPGCSYAPGTGLFSTAPILIPAGTFNKATQAVSTADVTIPAAVIPKT